MGRGCGAHGETAVRRLQGDPADDEGQGDLFGAEEARPEGRGNSTPQTHDVWRGPLPFLSMMRELLVELDTRSLRLGSRDRQQCTAHIPALLAVTQGVLLRVEME